MCEDSRTRIGRGSDTNVALSASDRKRRILLGTIYGSTRTQIKTISETEASSSRRSQGVQVKLPSLPTQRSEQAVSPPKWYRSPSCHQMGHIHGVHTKHYASCKCKARSLHNPFKRQTPSLLIVFGLSQPVFVKPPATNWYRYPERKIEPENGTGDGVKTTAIF